MIFSTNSIFEDDFNINQTKLFFCNEQNTKLIYENMHNLKIIAVAGSINGKIIECIEEKIKNKKRYYKVQFDNKLLGWIALEHSPRIYRIPKYYGKISNDFQPIFNNQNNIIDDISQKLLEARYYFEFDGNQYYLINRIGHRDEYLSILISDFFKYKKLIHQLNIELTVGEPLYRNSDLDEIVGYIERNTTVLGIGIYSELNVIKIKHNSKTYWIKKKVEVEYDNRQQIKNIEFVDKIMYLLLITKSQKSILEAQDKKIAKIKENIAISNDLEKLYLTRYLGDHNDFE